MNQGAEQETRPRLGALLFEVTTRCNLACPHCYNGWKGDQGGRSAELTTEQARALLGKALDESHCDQVAFTGGEPTLREDLEVLVAFVKGRGARAVLITNGTGLPESRIRTLLKAGLDLFELPLHGPSAAIHDAVLQSSGSFHLITRAAVDIARNRGQVAFVFVGTRHNIEHLEPTLELGIALGVRSFLFNRYNAGGAGHDNPAALMPSLEQVRKGLAASEACSIRYGVRISASIPIQPCLIDPANYPHVGFGFCAAGSERAYLTLDPLGNVRPCNHTQTVLGNLRTASLAQMLASQTMHAFREAHPPMCAECDLASNCQGGCKAAAEVCCGDLCGCDPFLSMNLR